MMLNHLLITRNWGDGNLPLGPARRWLASVAKGIHEERYRRLIARLAEQRRMLGLSQEAVALKLGRIQQFVSKYESGERRLDVVEFVDVAHALELDAIELLKTITR